MPFVNTDIFAKQLNSENTKSSVTKQKYLPENYGQNYCKQAVIFALKPFSTTPQKLIF